jgi:hypothetical protein
VPWLSWEEGILWAWSKVMAEFGLLHFSAVFTCFFFILL